MNLRHLFKRASTRRLACEAQEQAAWAVEASRHALHVAQELLQREERQRLHKILLLLCIGLLSVALLQLLPKLSKNG